MLKNSSVLRHWVSQRLTAVILLPCLVYFLFMFILATDSFNFSVYNLMSIFLIFKAIPQITTTSLWFLSGGLIFKVILLSILVLIFIHLIEGSQSILEDYVHQENSKILINLTFKVLQLILVKNLFLIIFI